VADPIQLPGDLQTWLSDRAAALGVGFADVLCEALYFSKSYDEAQRLEAAKVSAPSDVWAGVERELHHRNQHR
jgi:hypothetical protein